MYIQESRLYFLLIAHISLGQFYFAQLNGLSHPLQPPQVVKQPNQQPLKQQFGTSPDYLIRVTAAVYGSGNPTTR